MKKFFLLFIAMAAISFSFAQIPTTGLVAYYPFSGNANDSIGNNDGTVYGAALTTDRFGNPNSAYTFDGVNDYIKVSDAIGLNNPNFTYSAWVYANALPANGNASNLIEAGSGSGANYGVGLSINNNYVGTTGWRVTSGNTGATSVGGQTGSLPSANHWCFMTISRDNSSVKMYVNGQKVLTLPTAGQQPYYNNPMDIFIGSRSQLGLNQYFNGKLDDISIYNRALDSAEINALYTENFCFQTIYDTVTVYDTTHVTVFDTTQVTLYDTTFVSVTDTLIIHAVLTGVNPPHNINTIKVYPNPASDHVIIDNGNFALMNNYRVKIINTSGQEVFNSLITQQLFDIDLSSLTGKGIYFMMLYDPQNNIIEMKKIILQ
jgi:hypothetical protein